MSNGGMWTSQGLLVFFASSSALIASSIPGTCGCGRSASLRAKVTGSFAGGVHVSEEDVGQSLGSANSRIPHFSDAGDGVGPRHGDRAARLKHHDRFWIGRSYRADQRILIVRERERRGIVAFAHWLVDEDNGDLRCLGQTCCRCRRPCHH